MSWYVTLESDSYGAARRSFEWEFPDDYNIARDLLRKHDDADERVALYQVTPDGRRETYTFRDVDRRSNRLAKYLASVGVGRGDRVAVATSQQPATPVAHLACWKLGAISASLSTLFGEDAVRYRLRDSAATAAVVDESVADTVRAVAPDCPALDQLVQVGGDPAETPLLADVLKDAAPRREIARTDAETPALILYTSGSTGPPKGVLHTHGLWVGTCPSFLMYYGLDVRGDAVYWTPSDWAWIGALGNVVFPAWHYGRPIVGTAMASFEAERAFEVLAESDVTHAFLAPTALRMMSTFEDPAERYDLSLQVIASGSEAVTPEIVAWVEEALPGVRLNELYGQTEANVFVADCHEWFPKRTGSMGKPVPGHEVAIVDPATGEEKQPGDVGHVAIRYEGDPMVYAEYWNDPEATADARIDGWHLSGDLGVRDEDGYVSFKARDDDLIITSGYRVGPAEIEAVLLEHPAVDEVGVAGVPDDTRGEIVKAFVRTTESASDEDALRSELRDRVSTRHARYAYPREIEFVDELPKTTTGKVRRHALRERDAGGAGESG